MTSPSSSNPTGPSDSSGMTQHGQTMETASGKMADEIPASENKRLYEKASRLLYDEKISVKDMVRTSPVKKAKGG